MPWSGSPLAVRGAIFQDLARQVVEAHKERFEINPLFPTTVQRGITVPIRGSNFYQFADYWKANLLDRFSAIVPWYLDPTDPTNLEDEAINRPLNFLTLDTSFEKAGLPVGFDREHYDPADPDLIIPAVTVLEYGREPIAGDFLNVASFLNSRRTFLGVFSISGYDYNVLDNDPFNFSKNYLGGWAGEFGNQSNGSVFSSTNTWQEARNGAIADYLSGANIADLIFTFPRIEKFAVGRYNNEFTAGGRRFIASFFAEAIHFFIPASYVTPVVVNFWVRGNQVFRHPVNPNTGFDAHGLNVAEEQWTIIAGFDGLAQVKMIKFNGQSQPATPLPVALTDRLGEVDSLPHTVGDYPWDGNSDPIRDQENVRGFETYRSFAIAAWDFEYA